MDLAAGRRGRIPGRSSGEVDATPCKTVQRPVFRAAIDTPEPRAAEVCEPGAELKPQQSEQPKEEIAVGGSLRFRSGSRPASVSRERDRIR